MPLATQGIYIDLRHWADWTLSRAKNNCPGNEFALLNASVAMTCLRSDDRLVNYDALVRLAIFKTSVDPEPFVGNSHAAGRPETITSDDRNGFSTRDPLVLEGQR